MAIREPNRFGRDRRASRFLTLEKKKMEKMEEKKTRSTVNRVERIRLVFVFRVGHYTHSGGYGSTDAIRIKKYPFYHCFYV